MKLFTCVLARNPTSIDTLIHYALIIVPLQKQNFAEDLLRKRNFTDFIVEQISSIDNQRSSIDYSNKYVQFCASEGTFVRDKHFN